MIRRIEKMGNPKDSFPTSGDFANASGSVCGGMEGMNANAIPIVGWLLSFVFNASTAVPFWIIWTRCGLGKMYFYWLPAIYQEIPFWHCVGLFIVIGIILRVCTPQFAKIDNSSKSE